MERVAWHPVGLYRQRKAEGRSAGLRCCVTVISLCLAAGLVAVVTSWLLAAGLIDPSARLNYKEGKSLDLGDRKTPNSVPSKPAVTGNKDVVRLPELVKRLTTTTTTTATTSKTTTTTTTAPSIATTTNTATTVAQQGITSDYPAEAAVADQTTVKSFIVAELDSPAEETTETTENISADETSMLVGGFVKVTTEMIEKVAKEITTVKQLTTKKASEDITTESNENSVEGTTAPPAEEETTKGKAATNSVPKTAEPVKAVTTSEAPLTAMEQKTDAGREVETTVGSLAADSTTPRTTPSSDFVFPSEDSAESFVAPDEKDEVAVTTTVVAETTAEPEDFEENSLPEEDQGSGAVGTSISSTSEAVVTTQLVDILSGAAAATTKSPAVTVESPTTLLIAEAVPSVTVTTVAESDTPTLIDIITGAATLSQADTTTQPTN